MNFATIQPNQGAVFINNNNMTLDMLLITIGSNIIEFISIREDYVQQ